MTRAVVFLIATLLLASFGAVAQNKPSSSGGRSASATASVSAQNATPPAAPAANPDHASQGMTTPPASKSIQRTIQGENPGTGNRAELPQTSTILPLLGLLGLGSLVAGLFARR